MTPRARRRRPVAGEKQRVALARAFLKNADVLVCDEATSALDTRTEREIMGSLRELSRGRTTVFVAHRLSTVMHCDEIVVLDHGRVAERGSHDELIQARTRAPTATRGVCARGCWLFALVRRGGRVCVRFGGGDAMSEPCCGRAAPMCRRGGSTRACGRRRTRRRWRGKGRGRGRRGPRGRRRRRAAAEAQHAWREEEQRRDRIGGGGATGGKEGGGGVSMPRRL